VTTPEIIPCEKVSIDTAASSSIVIKVFIAVKN
jgi:hypothetical protein